MWAFREILQASQVKVFSLRPLSTLRAASAVGFVSVMLAGCSSVSMPNLWPFGAPTEGKPYVVPNATKYVCDAGKVFHLRMLESGAAWVIHPDREVRLDKQGNTNSFSNGIATLEMSGAEARLRDGPGIDYLGCKPAGADAVRN